MHVFQNGAHASPPPSSPPKKNITHHKPPVQGTVSIEQSLRALRQLDAMVAAKKTVRFLCTADDVIKEEEWETWAPCEYDRTKDPSYDPDGSRVLWEDESAAEELRMLEDRWSYLESCPGGGGAPCAERILETARRKDLAAREAIAKEKATARLEARRAKQRGKRGGRQAKADEPHDETLDLIDYEVVMLERYMASPFSSFLPSVGSVRWSCSSGTWPLVAPPFFLLSAV